MVEKKLYFIGNEELVLVLGLIGIDGKVVTSSEELIREFNRVTNNPGIGMIIISFELSEEAINIIIKHKLSQDEPLIFFLPDFLTEDPTQDSIFLKHIQKTIDKIIT